MRVQREIGGGERRGCVQGTIGYVEKIKWGHMQKKGGQLTPERVYTHINRGGEVVT